MCQCVTGPLEYRPTADATTCERIAEACMFGASVSKSSSRKKRKKRKSPFSDLNISGLDATRTAE
jgi:hypothetical protein